MFGPAPSFAEAERALQRKAEGGVSSDWEAAAASVNLGGPIATHRPKSKIVKDVQQLVDSLAARATSRRPPDGTLRLCRGAQPAAQTCRPSLPGAGAAPACRPPRRRPRPQTLASPPPPPMPPKHTPQAKGAPPSQLDIRLRLHSRLIEELDLAKLDKLDEKDMRREVMSLVADFARAERMALNTADLQELGASIYDEMVGLGPLEPLLKDDSINDILINGPFQVYVERRGELELTPVRFRDNDHLLRIVNRIVAGVGRRIDESQPMVDARLADGSRVNAAISPIAIDGAAVSIRKFSKKPADAREAGRVQRHAHGGRRLHARGGRRRGSPR